MNNLGHKCVCACACVYRAGVSGEVGRRAHHLPRIQIAKCFHVKFPGKVSPSGYREKK